MTHADTGSGPDALDPVELEARLMSDDPETTLVVGSWSYHGSGWASVGETALATAAAERAREYAQQRARAKNTTETGGTHEHPHCRVPAAADRPGRIQDHARADVHRAPPGHAWWRSAVVQGRQHRRFEAEAVARWLAERTDLA